MGKNIFFIHHIYRGLDYEPRKTEATTREKEHILVKIIGKLSSGSFSM